MDGRFGGFPFGARVFNAGPDVTVSPPTTEITLTAFAATVAVCGAVVVVSEGARFRRPAPLRLDARIEAPDALIVIRAHPPDITVDSTWEEELTLLLAA